MNEDKFLKIAKEAALEAGKVIAKYVGKDLDKKNKNGDHSNFATQADLESEKVILGILQKNFPKFNYIAEEKGVSDLGSDYTWVIDPLDGTMIFSSGLPYFTISIGLMRNKKPVMGIIYQPVTKFFYYAISGKGAYLNNKKIKVSRTNDLEKAVLGVDFGHKEKRARKIEKYILPLINKIRYPVSTGGDVLLFAQVASGVLDGFATETNIWDCMTGAIITTEAGGKITDGKGEEIDWSKNRMEIVASNGLIHDAILEALKK